MSDIPPTDPPPVDPTSTDPSTGDGSAAPVDNGTGLSDEQLLAMVEWLRSPLADMMTAAISEAQEAAPRITMGSGTVVTVTINDGTPSGGSATLNMDGDEAGGEIVAQIIGETPLPGDRVMVMFVPPSSAFVIGFVGGGGVPAGVIVATVRNITSDTSSSTALAPDRGYFWPHGQVIEQSAAPNLNNCLGTRFNTGGETATQVRLPDMRGRMLIGMDNMGGSDAGRIGLTNTVGTTGGSNVISSSALPSHTHGFTPTGSVTITSVTGSVNISDPGHSHPAPFGNGFVIDTGVGAVDSGAAYGYNSVSSSTGGATTGITASLSGGGGSASFSGNSGTTDGGSGAGAEHLPPVMVVHWMIKG